MGDTLWGTPAIRAIKKALPQVEIDLILSPQWGDLFFGNKKYTAFNLLPFPMVPANNWIT